MSNQREQSISKPTTGTEAAEDATFTTMLKKDYLPDQYPAVREGAKALEDYVTTKPHLIGDESGETLQASIADLDREISEQINEVLHHPEFQELESAWRGLFYLVNNTETSGTLKIRVLDVEKSELGNSLRPGTAWDQSTIFRKIYGEYDTAGAYPFGCIIGDYQFDGSPKDLNIMEGMAKIGAASHCPFIAAAAPGLLGLKSWEEVNDRNELATIFQTPGYEKWNSLRESADSRFLALAMPRFLARDPYSAQTVHSAPGQYVFEEKVDGVDHSKYLWANAAYAMGANISRAFAENGWCVQIRGAESGGKVEGLPCHHYTTGDGDVDMKCPTEVSIGDRRELELAAAGLMPLLHYKNTDYAVFVGAQSVQKPGEYYNEDANSSAKLSARLPYLFATSRFAHYLKWMMRDKVGSFKEREVLETELHNWLQKYVTTDMTLAGEKTLREKPLAEASVEVVPVEGNPGAYEAKFFLRPHYQLESINISMRLVARLPSKAT